VLLPLALFAGPFLLPGSPLTPFASCEGTVPCSPLLAPLLPEGMLDPLESLGFIAGPFLFPGAPLMPGPELGAAFWDVLFDGLADVSAASAGAAPRAARAHAAMNILMAFSILVLICGRTTHLVIDAFLGTFNQPVRLAARREVALQPGRNALSERYTDRFSGPVTSF
jgi:hypothetical protein